MFFILFHMYIAPGRGRQHFGDKILMTTERPFLFAHMLQVSKWSLRNLILYTFFMFLYLYSLGQGQKPLGDKLLMSTESPYDFHHLLQVSNKSLWILISYTFFNVFPHVSSPGAVADNPLWHLVLVYILMLLYMYIASRQGQITPLGQMLNFNDNRKAFSLCPYVASFKMISSKSDFIHIFNDFIHVYSPWARAYKPLGTNFWCQQKTLITAHSLQV